MGMAITFAGIVIYIVYQEMVTAPISVAMGRCVGAYTRHEDAAMYTHQTTNTATSQVSRVDQ